jgi:hydroxyacylglutathione hydrolase
MAIVAVPQLKDNYAYLVIDDASKQCGVVDCSEAAKVLDEVKRRGLKLTTVLPTHWHPDHVGGNQDLARAVPGLRVYGARGEGGRIPAMTDEVDDGDEVAVGPIRGRVIGIPAHTSGHVAYYFPALSAVFTGDTLFIGGCGRVFEGKAGTMVASLARLSALPDDTQVYCGHEYTEKNLEFALTLEPGNRKLIERLKKARSERANARSTVPSTMAEEKETNPFLRWDSREIQENLKQQFPDLTLQAVSIFARVRQLKDQF